MTGQASLLRKAAAERSLLGCSISPIAQNPHFIRAVKSLKNACSSSTPRMRPTEIGHVATIIPRVGRDFKLAPLAELDYQNARTALTSTGTIGSGESVQNRKESLPSAVDRLCGIHNRPIKPSAWLSGHRNSECSLCTSDRFRSPKAKRLRQAKWLAQFIACRKHLNRRCNQSAYVTSGAKKCASCAVRRSNGTFRNGYSRITHRRNYKRTLEKRGWNLIDGGRRIRRFKESIAYGLLSPEAWIRSWRPVAVQPRS